MFSTIGFGIMPKENSGKALDLVEDQQSAL